MGVYGSIDDGDPGSKNGAEGRNIERRGDQGRQPDLPMKKESSIRATDIHQDPSHFIRLPIHCMARWVDMNDLKTKWKR